MNQELANAQSAPECPFQGQVFFYCCESGNQHLSVCIAEGLKQLGIPYYSNINCWRLSSQPEDYLFRHDPNVTPDDCDVVVVEKIWVVQNRALPENIFHPERKYITVYLDDSDGPISPAWYSACQNFDFIFRTHCNNKIKYPDNFVPWVFGLSNRILRETCDLPNFQHRSRQLLVTFRIAQDKLELRSFGKNNLHQLPRGLVRTDPEHPEQITVEHPLRLIFRDKIGPLIEKVLPVHYAIDQFEQPPSDDYHYLQWVQTVQRHYPEYYERLKAYAASAAFGGYLVPSEDGTKPYLEWWDSWRFWESLAAGCVTFHVDFDKYGIRLPVMPENWRHYIGLDLDNLEDAVERIASNPGILEQISQSGRQWAIENYRPVPTALRFLETIASYSSANSHSLRGSLPVQLREINLIIFPNWSQEEEFLSLALAQVIRAIATHPDKRQMALLIDTSNIANEDAELAVSGIMMNLLMEEDLDVSDGLEISLIGQLSEQQWSALLPCLRARLILEQENQAAIAQAKVEKIPSWEISSLSEKRVT